MPTATLVKEARVREVPFRNNLLVNPGFEIWQRGAGPFVISHEPTADEWFNAAISGDTVSTTRTSSSLFGDYALQTSWVAVATRGIYQALECYKALEGQWLTFSCWVRTSTPGLVKACIYDYISSSDGICSDTHPGDGQWHLLTATKEIRTGLQPNPSWEHDYGIRIGVNTTAGTVAWDMDGAVCAAGYFPEGLQYVPPNPAQDMLRCERYYQESKSTSWASTAMWTGKTVSGNWYYNSIPFSTPMASTPTVTLTSRNQSAFPASSTLWCDGRRGFWNGRQASGSNNRGYFGDYWTAEVT